MACAQLLESFIFHREEQVAYQSDKSKHNMVPFEVETESSSGDRPQSSRQNDSPV